MAPNIAVNQAMTAECAEVVKAPVTSYCVRKTADAGRLKLLHPRFGQQTRRVAIPGALDDDVSSMRSPFPVKPSLLTLSAQFILTCKKIEILLCGRRKRMHQPSALQARYDKLRGPVLRFPSRPRRA